MNTEYNNVSFFRISTKKLTETFHLWLQVLVVLGNNVILSRNITIIQLLYWWSLRNLVSICVDMW